MAYPNDNNTGFDNLVYLAQNQTVGHFTDYGGTILTENHWLIDLNIFHTIWSDGLGGYWIVDQINSNIFFIFITNTIL